MSLPQITESSVGNPEGQATSVKTPTWDNTKFVFDGMGDIEVSELYQLLAGNIPVLRRQLSNAGYNKRRIDREVSRAQQIASMVGNKQIVGVNLDGTIRYANDVGEDAKLKGKDGRYLETFMQDLPTFRGFNKYTRPVQKAPQVVETEELPKFTDNTIPELFGALGIYENGALDLAEHEFGDTDPTNKHLTGFNARKGNIKDYFTKIDSRIRTQNQPVEGQSPTYTYNYTFTDDLNSRFRNASEYEAAYDALQAANTPEQFIQALSRFGIQNEADWVRSSNGTAAPAPPPPARQKTALETATEEAEQRAAVDEERLKILNLGWDKEWRDILNSFNYTALSPFALNLHTNYDNENEWDWGTERYDGENVYLRDRNFYDYLMKGLKANSENNNVTKDFNNRDFSLQHRFKAVGKDGKTIDLSENDTFKRELYNYLQHMFIYNNDAKESGGLRWNPMLVNTDLGVYYAYDQGLDKLYLKSIYAEDTPQDVYDYVHNTRKSAFELHNERKVAKGEGASTEKKLNGGTLEKLKMLRSGGVVKMYKGKSIEKVTTYEEWLAQQKQKEKEKRKQAQQARANDPTIEDPEWVQTVDLVSALLDTTGLIASFVPGYGGIASAALGGLGSVGAFTAGIARDGFQWRDDLGQFAFNLGSDLMGVIPGLGTSAKAAKFVKALPKIVNIIGIANFSVDAQQIIAKLNQNDWDISVLNQKDYTDLAQSLLPFMSGIGRMRNNAKTKKIVEKGIEKWGLDEAAAIKKAMEKGNYGVKNAATRMQWLNGSSDKLDDVAASIYGAVPAERTLRVVTPPAAQTSESVASKAGSWVGKGIGAVKRGWRNFTTEIKGMIDEAMDASFDKNGGKLEQLKALRKGGILKAQGGLKTLTKDQWGTATNQDDYINLYKTYYKTIHNKDLGNDWKPITKTSDGSPQLDSDFETFIGNQGLLNDVAYQQDNLAISNINPFSSNLEGLKFKQPNIGGLNFARQLLTTSANNQATELKQDSILDNIVLERTPQIQIDSLHNNFDQNMALENSIAQNYSRVAQTHGTDYNTNRLALLDALQIGTDATVKQNLANAQDLQTQQDNINDQLNQQAALNTETHNENMGRIAAANTAVADLESANLLNNAKVGTDALAEKVLAEEARAKEMNEFYLKSFSDSNALVYDNIATQLEEKYKILPTDSEYIKSVKKDSYEKELQMLQSQLAKANIQAQRNFYSSEPQNTSVIKNFDILSYNYLTDEKKQQYLKELVEAYGMDMVQNTLNLYGIKDVIPTNKKGGKLDNKTRLSIENSRENSKRIIQQMKSHDKGLDRLSKVTYKAILKSLGLK